MRVCIVHGSWRKEDRNRIQIEEAAKRYPNVSVTTAYMPEAYGTHHSKMCVLFRHDDLAQIIIMTGNYIRQDWIMSQALWKSPLLPFGQSEIRQNPGVFSMGSGQRFKKDFMAYLGSYGNKLKDLASHLSQYEFGEIRAALIASTPGKQNIRGMDPDNETLWGWPGLKHILKSIAPQEEPSTSQSQINIQISSVASVGERWLSSTFLPALSSCKKHQIGNERGKNSASDTSKANGNIKFSIVFPTAAEIRRSLNGYVSGASIHMKTSTAAQAKQLSVIRPMLCHWSNTGGRTGFSSSNTALPSFLQPRKPNENTDPKARQTHRGRAAPHIKTYIRFTSPAATSIDWAMMTSANLSTQAWGAAASEIGDVRISSYEIGVVVWPGLWDETAESVSSSSSSSSEKNQGKEGARAEMIPLFSSDDPFPPPASTEPPSEALPPSRKKITVGWRMPYDLPLVPYAQDEMPWSNGVAHLEPDWRGGVWTGGGR